MDSISDIAHEAFIYGLPPVDLYRTDTDLLSAAAVAMGAAGEKATESSANHTSTGMAVVLVVLGVLLLLVAMRNWRNRADASEPKVFRTIARMGPPAAAFLALGATFMNPKNLVLLLAAGQTIGAATSGSKLLIGGVFVLLATAPYTAAAGYALVGGAPAKRNLDLARAWLIAHNRLIMAVICGLLGALLVLKGAGGLGRWINSRYPLSIGPAGIFVGSRPTERRTASHHRRFRLADPLSIDRDRRRLGWRLLEQRPAAHAMDIRACVKLELPAPP